MSLDNQLRLAYLAAFVAVALAVFAMGQGTYGGPK